MNVNEIASLGSNVKPVIQNENCAVLMLNDATGEGVMTVYRVMPGVMICFSDMHMEQCASEFELKNDRKIFCIDHCREGRIEMEVKPGVFSIMQEKELRLDNRENYQIKVVELLLYLNTMTAEDRKEVRPYYYKTQIEKIKEIHAKIIGNLQMRFTMEELSSIYEIPLTTMKKCFKDVYGDSIYSYQKRYRMNVAANMSLQDKAKEIQEIVSCLGYENLGKFSSAFRSVMGLSPVEYRFRKGEILDGK